MLILQPSNDIYYLLENNLQLFLMAKYKILLLCISLGLILPSCKKSKYDPNSDNYFLLGEWTGYRDNNRILNGVTTNLRHNEFTIRFDAGGTGVFTFVNWVSYPMYWHYDKDRNCYVLSFIRYINGQYDGDAITWFVNSSSDNIQDWYTCVNRDGCPNEYLPNITYYKDIFHFER